MARRRYTRKGRKGRRRNRKRKSNSWAIARFPFGKRKMASLRYNTFITVNPLAGGAVNEHFFTANGLFDPDISGTGHQPLGFDQLMAIYDHFVVIGARISCWVTSIDTTYPQLVSLSVNDDTTGFTSITNVIENGTCKWRLFNPITAGAASAPKLMTYNVNPNKFLSRSKPMADPQLKGSVSGNPQEQCYFVIACQPTTSVDSAGIQVAVTIDYKAIFFEPVDLSQS